MMEGTLVIPPERGTIIGRALWKARYVVVGPLKDHHTDASMSQMMTTNRIKESREAASKAGQSKSPTAPTGAIYLSIYKSKDEWEPIQQHAISSVTECQVQMLAHRKQGPVLATLVINISPDPATDKLRKRRSSRTAGLTTTKETSPTTLWFRPSSDDRHSLHDWARCIQSFIQPNVPDRQPMSPITPGSPTFINPFAPRAREPSDYYQRPPSATNNPRGNLQHKTSSQTYSSRERDRPLTYSGSASLRSKRSDISSQTGSMNPSHAGFIPNQHYTTVHPTDLPSPATTVGEYQGEFIEGWTSAQGRSSTLSSPVRGRDSIGSQPPVPLQQPLDSSSPPGHRETILDRAFQLGHIPQSERDTVPGEEKLTSLARFDALMREVDERRKKKEAETKPPPTSPENDGLKSAWDLDDESDDDDDDDVEPAEEDDEDEEDEYAHEKDLDDDDVGMPPTAQRALNYIQGRRQQTDTRPQGARSPISYNPETLMALNSGLTSNLRPHTGYGRNRPGIAQRTYSQPQLAAAQSSNRDGQSASATSGKTPEDGGPTTYTSGLHRSATEKRQSASSTKRLSFTDFTKRLSSTSSLLLVQTNTSHTSSRGSSDIDALREQSMKGSLHPRGSPLPPSNTQDREEWDKRCGWRGSVGVFGAGEGGFL